MGKDLKGRELGKGLYQRKDGRYEARARINGNDVSIYGFNIRELKKDLQELKEQAQNAIEYRRRNLTLNEWFEEWFQTYKLPVVKETSVFPMKQKFYSSFGAILGERPVSSITNIDIQGVINRMSQEGRATSSMRESLGRMRECMESAKNNQIISLNPCFEINVPWENTQVRRRFLSREEQNTFLGATEHNWYKEMFYIMFLTGMRIGEVGGLMWKDVDFENKCLHINRSLSCQYEYGEKILRLTTPKTHNSYRKIPFFGEAEEMFQSQKDKVASLKKTLGKRWRATGEYEDLVFVTTMGSPVLRYHAEKEIKKVIKQINEQEAFDSVREQREPHYFEDLYPHAIRHTFCSRCFEADMQPKVVQSIMGHQHYSTTIDIYTHVTDEKYQDEIGKFGKAIEPARQAEAEEGSGRVQVLR
ncbi:tyrosine-type recombinase/integrase [Enterocloster clostridioformis]|uniref:tyrosine-type recombinase/integrase n=1 Tax=Enterocloster clostridioformis TaxID=1531 RepID=UPI0008EE5A18|nr:tyrosine-type recombinase/integrase [Enterocloster clostridioformis]SFG46974.1 Site-specific recombinase XerD [Enterocloster clostridioformis]